MSQKHKRDPIRYIVPILLGVMLLTFAILNLLDGKYARAEGLYAYVQDTLYSLEGNIEKLRLSDERDIADLKLLLYRYEVSGDLRYFALTCERVAFGRFIPNIGSYHILHQSKMIEAETRFVYPLPDVVYVHTHYCSYQFTVSKDGLLHYKKQIIDEDALIQSLFALSVPIIFATVQTLRARAKRRANEA